MGAGQWVLVDAEADEKDGSRKMTETFF